MRKRTVTLAIVFLLLAAFLSLYFVGGTLSAQVQVITAPASEYPGAYESIMEVIRSGSAPVYFSQESLSDIDRYTLMDVTIRLNNRGLFPAEWLEVTPSGISGDVAVYSLSGAGNTVDGRSVGEMNLKMITTADVNAPRVYTVEYYVLGMKRSIHVR